MKTKVTTIRIPFEIYQAALVKAKAERRSLNSLMVVALEAYCKDDRRQPEESNPEIQ